MPHLDFREALSTPEQKTFCVPAAIAVAQPQLPAIDSYFPEVGLSRSAWANIIFVAIAAIGGMVSAFYFFNGAELLRAAAAWPAEFLYPRPAANQMIEASVQPDPVDRYTTDSASAVGKKDDSQVSSDQNFKLAQVAQVPVTGTSFVSGPPTPTSVPPVVPPIVPVVPSGVTPIVPPVTQPIIPPVIPPVVPPGVPQPDSILGEVQKLVAGSAPLGQSASEIVEQTVTSMAPKKVPAVSARSSVSATRGKIATARQKASTRARSAISTSRATQSLTTQVPSSGIQNQTMFGGGMGTVSGSVGSAASAGSASSGVSGVGTPGGVTGTGVSGTSVGGVSGVSGVSGVGGVTGVGGLPGVGGISGGLPGVGGIGGLVGHH